MASFPRPYGVGPYGSGHYARYTGTVYQFGAVTDLRFGATARGIPLTRQVHAETAIHLGAKAASYRVISLGGRAGVTFGATIRGGTFLVFQPGASTAVRFSVTLAPSVVINREAETQIAFGATAVLSPTWGAFLAPCEIGAWGMDTAETGTWALAGPCEIGTWTGQLP